ncbi:MAG: signal peptidase II [Elusimicrobia bacterium]|nr:signal peptidase II [Elusimicrobiota bacterium]
MKSSHVALVALGVFAMDQVTKILVLRRMPLHTTIPIAPFFSLTHVQNTGAAFGILPEGNILFLLLTIAILAVLFFLHKRLLAQGLWTALGLSLLWGGALGNFVDRLFRGRVVDFLEFYWKQWHWPTFNVADSAICVGIFFMFFDGFSSSAQNR